ncbi:hypothetical protein [Actinophytocola sp. KF-1]
MTAGTAEKPKKLGKTAEKQAARQKVLDYIRNDVSNIDVVYPVTVIKSLSRLVTVKVSDSVEKKREKARLEKLTKEYKESGSSVPYKYVRNVSADMKRDFAGLEKVYHMLRDNIRAWTKLELMRFTEHGKAATDMAALMVDSLYKESVEVYSDWDKLIKDSTGLVARGKKLFPGENLDEVLVAAIDTEFDLAWYLLEQRATKALRRGERDVKAIEVLMNNALEFEGFKAVAIADPGKAQKRVKDANRVATQFLAASQTASEWVPSSAGTIHGSINAMAEAAVAFVSKVSTAEVNDRAAKKIMADPKLRAEALQKLNDNKLLVATYLKDKYIANLEYNLKMLSPLTYGGTLLIQVGLDATGAGAVAGPLVSQVWPALKEGLVAFVRGMQNARIERAAEEHGIDISGARGDVYAATKKKVDDWQEKAWGDIAEFLGVQKENKFVKQVEDALSKVAATFAQDADDTAKQSAASFLSAPGMMTQVAGKFASLFIEKIMSELKVKSAQVVTGDDIVAHVARNTNTMDKVFADLA